MFSRNQLLDGVWGRAAEMILIAAETRRGGRQATRQVLVALERENWFKG